MFSVCSDTLEKKVFLLYEFILFILKIISDITDPENKFIRLRKKYISWGKKKWLPQPRNAFVL